MARCADDVRHSTHVVRRVVWTTMVVAAALGARGGVSASESRGAQQSAARRNPHELRATELLERHAPGTPSHVRFEWDQVSGAREYLLSGRWTSPPSWAVQTREYRVTARNAASWTARNVAFETALPEGNHSWGLVALFAGRPASRDTGSGGGTPKLVGDYANPTTLGFDVR